MSILDRIVTRTRDDLPARKAAVPESELHAPPSDRDFAAALSQPGLSLIAEIKKKSPSRGLLREDFDPGDIAALYDGHASAISVLTDSPFFDGHRTNLTKARQRCRCPLLAKDFFVDAYQVTEARAHGADAILLMASVLEPEVIESLLGYARSLGMEALVEVHDERELDAVLGETSARVVGVNSRDLTTLTIDDETIFSLAPRVRDAGKIMVAESGVHSRAQVDRLRDVADAVLIGTSLVAAPDIAARIREFGW